MYWFIWKCHARGTVASGSANVAVIDCYERVLTGINEGANVEIWGAKSFDPQISLMLRLDLLNVVGRRYAKLFGKTLAEILEVGEANHIHYFEYFVLMRAQ